MGWTKYFRNHTWFEPRASNPESTGYFANCIRVHQIEAILRDGYASTRATPRICRRNNTWAVISCFGASLSGGVAASMVLL